MTPEENKYIKKVIDRVVSIRKSKDFSIHQFAKEVGIESTQLQYFESTGGAKTLTILKIITYLAKEGVSLEWLLLEDNSSHFKQANDTTVLFDMMHLVETLNEFKASTETHQSKLNDTMQKLDEAINKI